MGVLSKWLESLDYEYEILSTCTRLHSPRSTCDQCVSACQEKAVAIVQGKPVFNKNKCKECGVCIAACPVQAVAGIFPRRTIIQNHLIIQGKNIPTVKELLILYKKGIKTIVGETKDLIESWQQPVDQVNSILKNLGEDPISMVKKSVAEETNVSRRELFFLWKNEGKAVLKDIAPAKWRFNHHDMDLSKYYQDVQFAKISINIEKCTLCTACQKLCQKKCFDIREEYFSLSSQGCEKCGLCVDTCPEKAVLVEDHISKAEETLLPIYEKTCSCCHQTFKTLRKNDEKCVMCTKPKNIFKILEGE